MLINEITTLLSKNVTEDFGFGVFFQLFIKHWNKLFGCNEGHKETKQNTLVKQLSYIVLYLTFSVVYVKF